MTRIDAGDTPLATRRRNRSAMTAVLPVPAPATTRTEPVSIAAAARCSRPSLLVRIVPRPTNPDAKDTNATAEVHLVQPLDDPLGVEPQLVGECRVRCGDQDSARAE